MQDNTIVYLPKKGIKGKVRFLAIAAHHDDIEILATDGILRSLQGEGAFVGVVVTDGAGSARDGRFANYTNEMMKHVRIKEQKRAADMGKYQEIVFLNFPSERVKASDASVRMAMKRVITKLKPDIIYTHNLCDKHPTHVAVAHQLIQTINSLPIDAKPKALYGVEVWRDLDWMSDDEKVVFDVSKGKRLTQRQLLAHQSQVAGGKRYDLATIGRRSAHATYHASHSVDQSSQLIYAMDLTPLIDGREKSIRAFVQAKMERFVQDVLNQINE